MTILVYCFTAGGVGYWAGYLFGTSRDNNSGQ
jgi:hypothetical protein